MLSAVCMYVFEVLPLVLIEICNNTDNIVVIILYYAMLYMT